MSTTAGRHLDATRCLLLLKFPVRETAILFNVGGYYTDDESHQSFICENFGKRLLTKFFNIFVEMIHKKVLNIWHL